MNNKIIAVVVVLVLLAGAFLLWRNHIIAPTGINLSTNTGTDNDGATTVHPAPTASNIDSFTVTGSNFAFAPKSLSVKKGDTVKITFVNSSGTHDLKIDEFGVATPIIGGGQSATVTFVADKTGTFQYYCSVGSHRAMGMWGTLTVE